MFIQPCFIKKISAELKEKLKEFGYKDGGKVGYYGETQYLYCGGRIFYESPEIITFQCNRFIDCGTNEELFLALAALRDDTNENQWFITQRTMWDENYNGEITVYYEENEWLMWDYYSFMEDMPSDFRKATVEEIIEHFKDK